MKIYELCKEIEHIKLQIIFQWIPSHQKDIVDYKLADKYARKAHDLAKAQQLPISVDQILKEIKEKVKNQWKN